MDVLAILFWCCAGLVVYAYAGYPVLIFCLSRLFGRVPRARRAVGDAEPASVTLLIAAYNEESVIRQRLENALAADYPQGRLKIVIASDGSSDATADIVARYADRGVRLLDYPERRGKAAVLNSAMSEIDTDLVLLSDANTTLDPGAVRGLVRWFEDPSVAAACGRLRLVDSVTGGNVDSLYWQYEVFLKKCEGRLGALLGANGAIYAIRRDRYVPIPPNTIVDDFVIPLLAKLKAGGQVIYDTQSVATEETAKGVRGEFRRRARIGAGGCQATVLLWRLLDPRQGWIAFSFLSHKVLRWLCPLALVGMLVSSAVLRGVAPYRQAFIAQLAFYMISVVALYLPSKWRILKPLRLAPMFTGMNVALLVGLCRWVVWGVQKGTWERTARPADALQDSETSKTVGALRPDSI